jgi:hypothetical protein
LTYKSRKSWFLYCCDLYKKYGEVYWSRYKHGEPVTVDDIGLSEEEKWILKAVAASYKVYPKVADSIEKIINDHFGGIKGTLEK